MWSTGSLRLGRWNSSILATIVTLAFIVVCNPNSFATAAGIIPDTSSEERLKEHAKEIFSRFSKREESVMKMIKPVEVGPLKGVSYFETYFIMNALTISVIIIMLWYKVWIVLISV